MDTNPETMKNHGYANNHQYMQATDKAPKGLRTSQRLEVLKAFELHGPMTADEMMARLNLPHQTGSARVSELEAEGTLVPADEPKRTTRAGGKARVMRLSDEHLARVEALALARWLQPSSQN